MAQSGLARPSGTEVAGSNPVAPTKFYGKKFRIFYTTSHNIIDAEEIANHLLKSSKAICVNIFENVKSFYLEDKKIKSQKEAVLFIKTLKKKMKLKDLSKKFTSMILQ